MPFSEISENLMGPTIGYIPDIPASRIFMLKPHNKIASSWWEPIDRIITELLLCLLGNWLEAPSGASFLLLLNEDKY